jgi:hypothetical protein
VDWRQLHVLAREVKKKWLKCNKCVRNGACPAFDDWNRAGTGFLDIFFFFFVSFFSFVFFFFLVSFFFVGRVGH